jgi:EAL domain-containing protein (putative c-di-GMP-specific phosphodiesterase class I)
MFAAKNDGRNRYKHFDPAMLTAALHKRALINDLREAIHDQLVVYYQPIFDCRTQSLTKAEALVRWQHPQRGLISPADFIPLAEESGLIIGIGQFVFEQVCRDLPHLKQHYSDAFQVSINVSPIQFANEKSQLPQWINHLHNHQLRNNDIIIEITEGVMLDPNKTTINTLALFQTHGIEIALDDFGTGYSSLAYIYQYKIDYLKIDRSFIANLAQGSDALALCEAMILMAHKLGIQVIAEGVETDKQANLIQHINCDFIQGYLIAKPQPFTALMLDDNTTR